MRRLFPFNKCLHDMSQYEGQQYKAKTKRRKIGQTETNITRLMTQQERKMNNRKLWKKLNEEILLSRYKAAKI